MSERSSDEKPKRKTIRFQLRLPRDLYLEAKKTASDRGQSFNSWLSGMVHDAVSRGAKVLPFKAP